MENYKEVIECVYADVKNVADIGKVASYIPELAFVDPNNFGVAITTIDKESFGVGDFEKNFQYKVFLKFLH